jgi:hypothetical protein
MGAYVDDSKFDRRSAFIALVIVLAILGLAYGAAWITIGRSGRFQTLKSAFFSFDLPRSFVQIDQEGAGASITSLSESPLIERTFASALRPPEACRGLGRAFRKEEAQIYQAPDPAPDAICSFSGRVGVYPVRAELRTKTAFLEHVKADGLDIPTIPKGMRTIATITVREI